MNGVRVINAGLLDPVARRVAERVIRDLKLDRTVALLPPGTLSFAHVFSCTPFMFEAYGDVALVYADPDDLRRGATHMFAMSLVLADALAERDMVSSQVIDNARFVEEVAEALPRAALKYLARRPLMERPFERRVFPLRAPAYYRLYLANFAIHDLLLCGATGCKQGFKEYLEALLDLREPAGYSLVLPQAILREFPSLRTGFLDGVLNGILGVLRGEGLRRDEFYKELSGGEWELARGICLEANKLFLAPFLSASLLEAVKSAGRLEVVVSAGTEGVGGVISELREVAERRCGTPVLVCVSGLADRAVGEVLGGFIGRLCEMHSVPCEVVVGDLGRCFGRAFGASRAAGNVPIDVVLKGFREREVVEVSHDLTVALGLAERIVGSLPAVSVNGVRMSPATPDIRKERKWLVYDVVKALREEGFKTLSGLRDATGFGGSNLYKVLTKLERMGLVSKQEVGGRKVYRLTQSGGILAEVLLAASEDIEKLRAGRRVKSS